MLKPNKYDLRCCNFPVLIAIKVVANRKIEKKKMSKFAEGNLMDKLLM